MNAVFNEATEVTLETWVCERHGEGEGGMGRRGKGDIVIKASCQIMDLNDINTSTCTRKYTTNTLKGFILN